MPNSSENTGSTGDPTESPTIDVNALSAELERIKKLEAERDTEVKVGGDFIPILVPLFFPWGLRQRLYSELQKDFDMFGARLAAAQASFSKHSDGDVVMKDSKDINISTSMSIEPPHQGSMPLAEPIRPIRGRQQLVDSWNRPSLGGAKVMQGTKAATVVLRKYRLVAPVPTEPIASSVEDRLPWQKRAPKSPYQKQRVYDTPSPSPSPMSSDSDDNEDQIKGKDPNTNVGVDDSEDEDEDEDGAASSSPDSEGYDSSDLEESNRSRTKDKWLRKGRRKHWTKKQTKSQMNALVREVIREALHVEKNYQAFAREGVSAERLQRFHKNPDKYGPRIRNTFLDKTGDTTAELAQRPWNQALKSVLVELIEKIVRKSSDPKRFGKVKKRGWEAIVTERLYRVFLAEIRAHAEEGELEEEACDRMADVHQRHNARSKKTNIRHSKCRKRAQISAVLLQRGEQLGDEAAQKFWAYALKAVTTLGPDGMSDESDAEETRTTGKVVTKEKIRQVKVLGWRNPALVALLDEVDAAPLLERGTFNQAGRGRLRRVRVQDVVERVPPAGLYRSFFKDGYIKNLPRWEVKALEIKKEDLPTFGVQVSD
ncbi:hypothetical protein V5O48_011679 [Marasmius crinis-equi]|uniref:Uncharacterized protein n=1 Tax=Marasmius crinis-equi TaxID=585013 RepID=A0ABR3F4W0_9AGAR